MKNKTFFLSILLLFIFTTSFSSQIWVNILDSESTTKPEIFNNQLIIATKSGTIYALNPLTGARIWSYSSAKKPNQMIIDNNAVVIGSNVGEITALGLNGNVVWKLNLNSNQVTELYSIKQTERGIFSATDKGIFFLDKSGNIRAKILNKTEVWGKIATKADYAIVGNKNELIRINEAGSIIWTQKIKEITSFEPTINNNFVFISDSSGKIYKINTDTGTIIWEHKISHWVGTNIIIYQDNVIFADTDGKIYSLDYSDGTVKWTIETNAGIFGIADEGVVGNKKAAFFGTSGNGLLSIDIEEGEIIWKGLAGTTVKNPKFFQNKVYFTSNEKTEYAFTTDKACAIIEPKESAKIDKRELKIAGKYISDSLTGVEFKINDNEWQSANIDGSNWFGFVDPEKQLQEGINTIYCRPSGEESSEYSSTGIIYDSTSTKGDFLVTINPREPKTGETVLIKINDAKDGKEVEKVSVKIDGNTREINSNTSFKAPQNQKSKVEITKPGYNTQIFEINIKGDGIDPIILLIGAMVTLFVGFVAYQKFVKKK